MKSASTVSSRCPSDIATSSTRADRPAGAPHLQLFLSASLLALSVLAAGQALAADATPSGPALEEVIITARQRSENLQDTPFSIAAVTAERLDAMNVQTTMDLDNRVPGLALRPDNNRFQPFIGIRGVGDISRNPGIDNRTGIYLDGVPLGRSSSVSYPIYDVESIEVLRGPQGTLFGNNSLTGVLSIQSQKPTMDDSAKVTVGAGSRKLFYGNGYVNAVVADNLAVRVTLAGRSQDGFYKNLYNDSTAPGGTNYAGRLQVRYTPSADTTLDISADGVSAKDGILLGVGGFYTGAAAALKLPAYTINQNVPPTRDRTIYGASATLTQKLPADFTLTAISSYRKSKDRFTYDGDGTPSSLLDIGFKYTDWSTSQEVRIASPANELFDYVVGAFYYHQNPGEVEGIRYGADFPVAAQRGSFVNGGGTVKEDQTAVFAHGTLRPVSWLAVDAGVRYQHTRKEAHKVQAATAVAAGYPAADLRLKLAESNINPLVSVTVKPMDGFNVYALYSTGGRAGGFNMDVLRSLNGIEFAKESVRNYEVGAKMELFDKRLRLNIAAYSERFKDFQQAQNIIDPNPPPGTLPTIINVITNAARVKSEGIEVDFQAAVTQDFHISGGVGFNHARFVSFPNGGGPGVNYTGNNLIEAPRFQGSVTFDYRHELTDQLDGRASLTYTTRSRVFSQPANNVGFNDNRYVENSFGDLSGRVSVTNQSGNLEFAVFAKNLTDETHVDGASPNSAGYLLKQLSEPRTVGVELTLRR